MGSISGRAVQTWEKVRGHAVLVDGGLAVALSVVGVVGLTRPADGALFPVAVGLTLVATSAVAWRDRAPVVAVVSAAAATVGYQWLTRANSFPLGAGLALLFLLYTAGVRGLSRRHLAELAGLGVMTIGMSIAIVAASGPLKGSTVVTDVLPPWAPWRSATSWPASADSPAI